MFERDAAPVAAEELEAIDSDAAVVPEAAVEATEDAPAESEGEQA